MYGAPREHAILHDIGQSGAEPDIRVCVRTGVVVAVGVANTRVGTVVVVTAAVEQPLHSIPGVLFIVSRY